MSRRLKPQVKAVLIIITVIIGAILLENMIGLLVNVTEDVRSKREIEKQREEYETTPEYEEETHLNSCVKKAIEYLNSGDYDSLYNILDPDYKEIMQIDSIEEFKNTVDSYIGDVKSAQLLEYELKNDKYICEVVVTSENGSTNLKRMIVTPLENEKFYVVLDYVNSIRKYNEKFRKIDDKVDYKMLYKMEKGSSNVYAFEVKNLTDKDMIGSFTGTYLINSNYERSYVKNIEELTNITIPAGETVRLNFDINVIINGSYTLPDEAIYIIFDSTSGEDMKHSISLIREYWE